MVQSRPLARRTSSPAALSLIWLPMAMRVTSLLTGVSRSRATAKEDNMTMRSGPSWFATATMARVAAAITGPLAEDADDSVGSVHGLGDRCTVGRVAFNNIEVGIGDAEFLSRPNECRDVMALSERLLDQRNAGGASGAEKREVHVSTPIAIVGPPSRPVTGGCPWRANCGEIARDVLLARACACTHTCARVP